METVETALEAHPFWQGLPPQYVAFLAKHSRLVHFAAGETVHREGQPAGRFYLLRRGKVAVEAYIPARGPVTIQTLGRGDALGWSWLFPPCQWHFDARALEETEAIASDASQLLANADADHDFGYELMKRMVQVLFQRLQATRMQLLELYDHNH